MPTWGDITGTLTSHQAAPHFLAEKKNEKRSRKMATLKLWFCGMYDRGLSVGSLKKKHQHISSCAWTYLNCKISTCGWHTEPHMWGKQLETVLHPRPATSTSPCPKSQMLSSTVRVVLLKCFQYHSDDTVNNSNELITKICCCQIYEWNAMTSMTPMPNLSAYALII